MTRDVTNEVDDERITQSIDDRRQWRLGYTSPSLLIEASTELHEVMGRTHIGGGIQTPTFRGKGAEASFRNRWVFSACTEPSSLSSQGVEPPIITATIVGSIGTNGAGGVDLPTESELPEQRSVILETVHETILTPDEDLTSRVYHG